MRQDQLEKARLERWRQDGNALLTLDDAERWLADTPLCLYLPRRQHLPVPAPSFVEAIAGRADATPGPEQIAAAAQMLARLVASGAVVALNLFGSGPGGFGAPSGIGAGFVGEQPDFLATPEALPYLYALQPERNPKRGPITAGNGRVSPLAAETWKLLEREGALTTSELRTHLGREVTEAAVLRALAELWHTMRVVPVPAENAQEGAHWELLTARHRRELTIGSTQSQTTALSILVSFYLQSAVAATEEEAEIFLSPVASRSRIRDVIHGLSTTRQLASFPLNGEGQLYVEGSLPELPEEEPVAAAAIGEDAGTLDAGLEQNEPDLTEAAAANPAAITQERPATSQRSSRPAFGDRARGSFAARDRRTPSRDRGGPSSDRRETFKDRPPRREDGGFRRPERSGSSQRGSFRRAEGGAEGSSRPPRPNFERRARPSFAASADRGERPARTDSADRPKRFERSDRPGRPDRPARPARFDRGGGAGASRGGFDKRPSFDKGRPPRPAGSSFRPEKSGKPFGDRPPRSGEGADRPRFRPATGSPRFGQDRPARPPRDGERPRRSFGSGEGARPPGGPRRFENRSGGSSRPGGFSRPPRRDGDARLRRDGESSAQGDRPFKRPYASAGDRPPRRGPAGGFGKPGFEKSGRGDRSPRSFTPRPRPEAGNRPEGDERPSRPFRPAGQRSSRPGGFGKSAGSFRKPGVGKPAFGKPNFRKPADGDRPDRPRSPRPAFGSGKPGGFRKPGVPGKSFGKPRPAGKGRTSTTTSSGKPRRPGGFGAGTGRPPAKGGFKAGGFKPGGKRPAPKRPGGSGAPRTKPRSSKPRSEGDEG